MPDDPSSAGAICNDMRPYLPSVPLPGWVVAPSHPQRAAHYFDPVRALCWRWETYNTTHRTAEAPAGVRLCATCARKRANQLKRGR